MATLILIAVFCAFTMLLMISFCAFVLYLSMGGFQKLPPQGDPFVPLADVPEEERTAAIQRYTGDTRFTEPLEMALPHKELVDLAEALDPEGGDYQ